MWGICRKAMMMMNSPSSILITKMVFHLYWPSLTPLDLSFKACIWALVGFAVLNLASVFKSGRKYEEKHQEVAWCVWLWRQMVITDKTPVDQWSMTTSKVSSNQAGKTWRWVGMSGGGVNSWQDNLIFKLTCCSRANNT